MTAEKLVETDRFRERPELTLVPGFMVAGCCVVPNGAWPGSLAPDYQVSYDEVQAYVDDAEQTIEPHMSRAPELNAKEPKHV